MDASFDADTARRLALALALSAVVHAGVILAIRAGPPSVSTAPGMPIEARIEPAERPAEPEPPLASAALASMQAVAERPATSFRAASQTAHAHEPLLTASAPAPLGNDQASNAATGAQAPLAPDSAYYAITALDRPPAPLTRPDACYPHGATGEVTYELMIDELGTVNQATVLAVKPVGLFTAAAAELCSALKFSPAIKDGRAVRSRVRFVVRPG
ncbi:MAG: energy transducer TonB [Burkholderiales bacterium]